MGHSTSSIERNVTRVSVVCGLLLLLLIASLVTVQWLLEHSVQQIASATNDLAVKAEFGRLLTLSVSVISLGIAFLAARRMKCSVRAAKEQNRVLMQLSVQLTQANASLEQTIATRTAALQSVLDNTGEGVMAVSPDGTLCEERSRMITHWFGVANRETKLWDFLGGNDSELRDRLYLGFDQIVEGILPFEVSADQAPNRLERNGQHWSLEYRQILEDGQLDRVLVIVRDVTAQRLAVQAEEKAREFHLLVGQLLKDRTGFQRAISDCELLINQLCLETDGTVLRRKLHTLKGNAAMTGFRRLAALIHDLESTLESDSDALSRQDLDRLQMQWNESKREVDEYLRPEPMESILVDVQALTALADSVRTGAPRQHIAQTLDTWRHELVEDRFQMLAQQIQRTAKSLGKSVELLIDGGQVRMARDRFANFWNTMVHVVCNAVDHGIEAPAVRIACGKSATGLISLRAFQDDKNIQLIIEDDGRGIDWVRVKSLSVAKGLPCATHQDLIDALFTDRFSTRSEADELSGRGVGLSAVRAACEAVGAQIAIESIAGQQTQIKFIFPLEAMSELPVDEPETSSV